MTRVEVVERGQAERELVAESYPQDAHAIRDRVSGADWDAAPRQRREQYFTFSQSFSHFLRQANDRPHTTQTLVGRSALRII